MDGVPRLEHSMGRAGDPILRLKSPKTLSETKQTLSGHGSSTAARLLMLPGAYAISGTLLCIQVSVCPGVHVEGPLRFVPTLSSAAVPAKRLCRPALVAGSQADAWRLGTRHGNGPRREAHSLMGECPDLAAHPGRRSCLNLLDDRSPPRHPAGSRLFRLTPPAVSPVGRFFCLEPLGST